MLGYAKMETTLGYLHAPEGKINEITKKIGKVSERKLLKKKLLSVMPERRENKAKELGH
jgi:hypothetical protein